MSCVLNLRHALPHSRRGFEDNAPELFGSDWTPHLDFFPSDSSENLFSGQISSKVSDCCGVRCCTGPISLWRSLRYRPAFRSLNAAEWRPSTEFTYQRTDRGREDAEWTNPLLKQAANGDCVTRQPSGKRRLEVVSAVVTVIAFTFTRFPR